MLIKILLTLGLIYIVYIAFFKKPALKRNNPNDHKVDGIDEMVACAHCGTYITVDDSIISLGKSYCSKECVKANI